MNDSSRWYQKRVSLRTCSDHRRTGFSAVQGDSLLLNLGGTIPEGGAPEHGPPILPWTPHKQKLVGHHKLLRIVERSRRGQCFSGSVLDG